MHALTHARTHADTHTHTHTCTHTLFKPGPSGARTDLDFFIAYNVNEVSQQLMAVLLLEAFETRSPENHPIPFKACCKSTHSKQTNKQTNKQRTDAIQTAAACKPHLVKQSSTIKTVQGKFRYILG